MKNGKCAKFVQGAKLDGNRGRGRPKLGWIGRTKVTNWRNAAQNRNRWRIILNEIKIHPGL